METVIQQKLPRSFYVQDDVVALARNLIGKTIHTHIAGVHVSASITETEAYAGVTDRASHAWGGRRTQRTEVMYACGGTVYVYLCYGMHYLFNIVTNVADIPHAVLVRAVSPEENAQAMLARAGKQRWDKNTGKGPGRVTKLLGIDKSHNGLSLLDDTIFITGGKEIPDNLIKSGPRIGIDYAGADALLPWRFFVSE